VDEIEVVGFMCIWPVMALFVPVFAQVLGDIGKLVNLCDLAVMCGELASPEGWKLPRAPMSGSHHMEGIGIKRLS
jgi:hypothetical protein